MLVPAAPVSSTSFEDRCGDQLVYAGGFGDVSHFCRLPAGHEGRHRDGPLSWANVEADG